MNVARGMKRIASLVACTALTVLTVPSLAHAGECKEIHASLVEHRFTTGCAEGVTTCFRGDVDGNHDFRGTTYFNAVSAARGPVTAPGWVSYAGVYQYQLDRGTIDLSSTGITNPTIVTEVQQIVAGTGEWAGATGTLFVSGFKNEDGSIVTTQITGEICVP